VGAKKLHVYPQVAMAQACDETCLR
jgi:hypothetical protein